MRHERTQDLLSRRLLQSTTSRHVSSYTKGKISVNVTDLHLDMTPSKEVLAQSTLVFYMSFKTSYLLQVVLLGSWRRADVLSYCLRVAVMRDPRRPPHVKGSSLRAKLWSVPAHMGCMCL